MTKSGTQTHAVLLNAWAGRCEADLLPYISQKMAEGVDIFMLTEVTWNRKRRDGITTAQTGVTHNEPAAKLNLSTSLIETMKDGYKSHYSTSDYSDFYCLITGNTYKKIGFGSQIAIKSELNALYGSTKICSNLKTNISPRVLQWVIYEKEGTKYLVAHLHGIWIRENTKGDHPARIQQSEEVLRNLGRLARRHGVKKVVFGGDLNLAPETEALAKLISGQEPHSLTRNLIAEHSITSTRTPLYRKYGQPGETQLADYVLVSNAVEVVKFSVGCDPHVSDHAPLEIVFS